MKRFCKFLLLLGISLAVAPSAAAQSADELMEEVEFLSGPALEGRGFGSPGGCAASFYIFRQFRNAGLRTSFQNFESGGKIGHNVIGVTPGWFRSYIVVSAYYDGVGKFDGVCYPGADANASGVAALLWLARNLPALCTEDVGLVFVAFDGHGASLSGSKAFLDRHAGRHKLKMLVNMELLGSDLEPLHESRPEYLIALGGARHRLTLDWANLGLKLDLSTSYYGSENFTDLFYRRIGDQRWFLEADIPAVMFTSGITEHTNKVSDTADNLAPETFAKRVKLIGEWISFML